MTDKKETGTNKKTKKLIEYILISLIIVGIAIAFAIEKTSSFENKFENKNEDNFLTNANLFPEPDRIVYKNDVGNYYIFDKSKTEYKTIFENLSKGVDELRDGIVIEESKLDEMKQGEAFVEFDYNTISKNFIFPLNEDEIGVIKMLEKDGQVQCSQLKNREEVKKYMNTVAENIDIPYSFRGQDTYTSDKKVNEDLITSLGFELKADGIYQKKFTENYQEVTEFLNKLEFSKMEDIQRQGIDFTWENIIITVSRFNIENVKQNVGNIKFTFNNKASEGYTVSVTKLSKVPNINCVYCEINGTPEYPTIQQGNANVATASNTSTQTSTTEAKKEIERYLLNGYRVDIGSISEVHVDSAGKGYIIVECRIGLNDYVYPVKLNVNSQTETYLGMGIHLQSNYGYIPHEMCNITLDTKITDIDNIQGYVKTIEYIAD